MSATNTTSHNHSSINNNETNSILAIACGPLVTTWDTLTNTQIGSIAGTGTGSTLSNGNDSSSKSSCTSEMIDATFMLKRLQQQQHHDVQHESSSSSSSDATIFQSKLQSMGICQFQPFDYYKNDTYIGNRSNSMDGMIVNDIAWNHNGQGEKKAIFFSFVLFEY